ncbi:hypothetical protein JHK82_056090 [Glycine max]|nr:hypothetical protein JHK86_055915 [Glycine max]KAG5077395.1 hypothetical protein JHK82_056090 [Glycine max]KAH1035550.1 hypothetical protein GYH30_055499 [Glycine max]
MSISFRVIHPRTTPYWERALTSIINPTNQHKTFQRVLSSLTHFMGNFPEGYSSHNYSKPITLNCRVLM